MREALPIDAVLPEVTRAASGGTFVLVAPPGAGKSTRVPPALAAQVDGRVLVLEPRRVAARAAARRMAAERDEPVGRSVGWQVRFERTGDDRTRIWCLTEGILLRRLQADPLLDGVGAVLLDEVHERGLEVDLCLALLREVREARPELVVGAMSATIDPGPLAAFLGAPVVRSDGRAFPVDVRHLPFPDDRPLHEATADGVRRVLGEGDGDVLVFLPGVGEIRRTAELLAGCGAELVPLYGDLSPEEQDRALRPGAGRRVVLATNVAETSVTVPGVTAVVDSGRVRRASRDPGTGLDRLDVTWVSRASADQRAGRAGRTAPGRALRLWTERHHRDLLAADPPEVQRVDLAGPVLQLLAWGADPHAFGWLEPPPAKAVDDALGLLGELGAVRDGLTPLGRRMAELPLHPRLARLLLAAPGPRAALAAAALSERDPGAASVDLLERLERPTEHVRRVASRLRGLVGGGVADEEALRRAVLAAWPDRVARRRAPGSDRALLTGGRGVVLAGRGVEEELFVAVDVRDATPEATVRVASGIDPAWLPTTTSVETSFDEATGAVRARRLVRYRDLVLQDHPASPDPEQASALLAAVLAARPELAAPDDEEHRALLVRWAFAHRVAPDRVPPRDVAGLVPALCDGRRALSEVRRAPWPDLIRAAIGYLAFQALEALAPERLEVPSGSRIRLQWEEGRPPVLAVRIQELFGLDRTPTVGGGRIPVLLHLLAPNHRPQQITDDLAGFWARTWPEVRKELRARYPRHAWPEDPLGAEARSRPAPRR